MTKLKTLFNYHAAEWIDILCLEITPPEIDFEDMRKWANNCILHAKIPMPFYRQIEANHKKHNKNRG